MAFKDTIMMTKIRYLRPNMIKYVRVHIMSGKRYGLKGLSDLQGILSGNIDH